MCLNRRRAPDLAESAGLVKPQLSSSPDSARINLTARYKLMNRLLHFPDSQCPVVTATGKEPTVFRKVNTPAAAVQLTHGLPRLDVVQRDRAVSPRNSDGFVVGRKGNVISHRAR